MKAAFFILSILALGACQPRDEPGSFRWKGQAVDPICVDALVNGEGLDHVMLPACTGSAGQSEYQVPEKGIEEFPGGAIGYHFKCAEACMKAPYTAYRILGAVEGDHILEVSYSGGGTGDFSSIVRVKIDGDHLRHVTTLAGGDRCNGGIAGEPRFEDGNVYYSQNITPYDLVELSEGNKSGFKAYDDVQSCAACCVGTADFENDKMVSVTVLQDAIRRGDGIQSEGMTPVDSCFFKTMNTLRQLTLDATALKAFGVAFDKACHSLKKK